MIDIGLLTNFMWCLVCLVVVIFIGVYLIISVCIGNSSRISVKSDKLNMELDSKNNSKETLTPKNEKMQHPTKDVASTNLTDQES